MPVAVGQSRVIDGSELGELISSLKELGYRVIGPTIREEAIVYDEIGEPADLPEGWTDEQDGGTYRLKRLTPRAVGAPERQTATALEAANRILRATSGSLLG